MTHRYSRSAKEKWIADSRRPPRRPPVVIPTSDNTQLIEENKLTLIGRVTNPTVQKTRALVDFFTQHWSTVGVITGRDLGPHLFQFRFESEHDLQAILRKAPYHFKKWMIILQRWEPIISDNFPAKIPFWIKIHDLPLHFWNELTINTIGEELGFVEDRDVDHGRVRVLINGLKPLEMHLDISLAGEIKKVELEYEKLEKHCFTCHSLSHENGDCPSHMSSRDLRTHSGTISQTRTLDRLEDSRRRRDERIGSRDPRNFHSERDRWNNTHREPPRGPPRALEATPRTYSVSHRPSPAASAYRDSGRRSSDSRPGGTHLSESRAQDPAYLSSHRDRNLDSPSRGHNKGTWVRKTPQSLENRLALSQVSHTPSPRPEREPFDSPLQSHPATVISPRERGSAMSRLSIPIHREQLIQRGASILESGRLQDVEIQYLEDNLPSGTNEVNSIPSSSRGPIQNRLSLPQLSPIRSLSEDRRHVFERLGDANLVGNADEDGEIPVDVNLVAPPLQVARSTAASRAASKAAGKRIATERATTTKKRTPLAPPSGVSVKRRRVTRVQNSPKRKVATGNQPAKKGTKAPGVGAHPSTTTIPAITRAKAGFHTAKGLVP